MAIDRRRHHECKGDPRRDGALKDPDNVRPLRALLPGSRDEMRERMDAYLERANDSGESVEAAAS
jgi:hypothetical protein